ncbi:MAG: hypothetical protein HYX41_03575 [Bdellovibrio sp.]|nr:hypothetical protein [Bdellovibrio sp.]
MSLTRTILRQRISKLGVAFGLFLALPLLAIATLEAALVWNVMKGDSTAFVQQAIGDTTQFLANYFKQQISETTDKLSNLVIRAHERATASKQSDKNSATDSFEFDAEVLDFAVFSKGREAGVFDLGQNAERSYWVLNVKHAVYQVCPRPNPSDSFG